MTRARAVTRVLLSLAMVGVGTLHFLTPAPFVRMVPPALPWPEALVALSGAAEIGLGLLLLWPRARRLASYGLVALYVAVFPANVHMAIAQVQLDPEHPAPAWVPWARLPFQALFIGLALWVGRR